MHSKPAAFFVPRLPFFFPPVPTISASPSLPTETGQPASSPTVTHTSHRPAGKGCVFQTG